MMEIKNYPLQNPVYKKYALKLDMDAHEAANYIKNYFIRKGEKVTLNDAIVKAIMSTYSDLKHDDSLIIEP